MLRKGLRDLILVALLTITFMAGRISSPGATDLAAPQPDGTAGLRENIVTSLIYEFPDVTRLPLSLMATDKKTILITIHRRAGSLDLSPLEIHDRIYRAIFQSPHAVADLRMSSYTIELETFDDQGTTLLKTRARSWEEWSQR